NQDTYSFASSQETLITGRRPLPQPWSLGVRLLVQPPPATQVSHSANVTSNLPTANGALILTRCGGFSLSLSFYPIMNSPRGTTTIVGQLSGQSRNSRSGPSVTGRFLWSTFDPGRFLGSTFDGASTRAASRSLSAVASRPASRFASAVAAAWALSLSPAR